MVAELFLVSVILKMMAWNFVGETGVRSPVPYMTISRGFRASESEID